VAICCYDAEAGDGLAWAPILACSPRLGRTTSNPLKYFASPAELAVPPGGRGTLAHPSERGGRSMCD